MGGQRDRSIVEQQFEALFRLNPNAVALLDMSGCIVKANDVVQKMILGMSEGEIVGRSFEIFMERLGVTGHDLAKAWQLFRTACSGEIVSDHFQIVCQNVPRAMYVTEIPVFFENEVVGVFVVAQDLTAALLTKYELEESVHRSSHHDALTGLPNRPLFQDLLTTALARVQDDTFVALFFLDLDNFKIFNDTMGHAAGDDMLIKFATRLQRCLAETHTLCRISGDEFTIILPDLPDHSHAEQLAQRILDAMRVPFELSDQSFFFTCSIGIAICPDHGNTPELLMQNADTAMYQSKQNGKNKYEVYHYTVNQRMAKRMELERALRQAIDEEQFTLFYQPLVDTTTHEMYGAEALIRWYTPSGQMIPPSDFIPLAEETGLIVELGAWVLRTACLQVKAWQERGCKPLRVSVNLSTRQFQDPYFLEKVDITLAETQVPTNWIGLEITESLIMKNVDYAIGTLRELQRMGFEISVDDFGTGYSSLGYLKTLPIDKLKIDQTFIRDLTTKPEDKTITKAIISLAHNLGLKVVAEGVETEAHVAFLEKEGCDELQGYYFSKPISAEEFEGRLLGGVGVEEQEP